MDVFFSFWLNACPAVILARYRSFAQRLFVWDGGKKVEISSEHASTLETVHLAPGTILQRSSRVAHVVMLWMDASDDALVEHAIPDMSKPRLMPKDEVSWVHLSSRCCAATRLKNHLLHDALQFLSRTLLTRMRTAVRGKNWPID